MTGRAGAGSLEHSISVETGRTADSMRPEVTGAGTWLEVKSAFVGVLSVARGKGDRDGLVAREMLRETQVGSAQRSLWLA